MARTYRAVLRGDRVEWIDPPPNNQSAIPVHIILMQNAPNGPGTRGGAMADALEDLARMGGLPSITDPIAWQRDVREDRSLPERGV